MLHVNTAQSTVMWQRYERMVHFGMKQYILEIRRKQE